MIDQPRPRVLPSHRHILLVAGVLAGLGILLGLTLLRHSTWSNVVFLGTVEGVTEFLPISSTGHLLIAGKLIGFQNSIGGTFEIFIQLGAVLAVFALIPGVSRSGASIIGRLEGGLDRATATTFSFYLALPTLGAATVVDLLGSIDQIAPGDVARLALGMLIAFLLAWLNIGWLLRFVARHTFVVFGVYRILTGVIMLVLIAVNWL